VSAAATVTVRVRPGRALTLTSGDEHAGSVLHVAGAELELEAADARALVEQGFVALADAARPRHGSREHGGDDDLE
jgi:hypothetical protein